MHVIWRARCGVDGLGLSAKGNWTLALRGFVFGRTLCAAGGTLRAEEVEIVSYYSVSVGVCVTCGELHRSTGPEERLSVLEEILKTREKPPMRRPVVVM